MFAAQIFVQISVKKKKKLMFTDVRSVFAKTARADKAHNPRNSPHYVDVMYLVIQTYSNYIPDV